MSSADPRHQKFFEEFEAEQNARIPENVFFDLHYTLQGKPGRESGLDGYSFTINFPRVGAALLPVNWIICAMEACCIALEEVDFDYSECGCCAATFYVGSGTTLTLGMRQFIDWMATAPRLPAFEWSLEVLPEYSRIAAIASFDPVRFRAVGLEIRHALLSQAPLYLPDTCLPCDGNSGSEAISGARDHTLNLLACLRSGLARLLAMKLGGTK